MKLSTTDTAHILLALAALLVAAHLVGSLFASARQPRVIGEIVGGILLGPTVLGALAPDVAAWLFPSDGATPVILSAISQLGLLLLLFCAGAEIRSAFSRDERDFWGRRPPRCPSSWCSPRRSPSRASP
jgi:Kef-type K+ transport system membrane component KefB